MCFVALWHSFAHQRPFSVVSVGSVPQVTTATTTNNYECGLKGICNRDTGLCECFDAYVSSDGFGNRGTRGDCGYLDRSFYNS